VVLGKSQDVHTGTSFVDVMVGDSEVADVNPLTDHTLSILGKKIGTTRVTVYAEGKKLVGIYDVEVGYDISRLINELRRRFPESGLRASSVNGRIMLAGAMEPLWRQQRRQYRQRPACIESAERYGRCGGRHFGRFAVRLRDWTDCRERRDDRRADQRA
jgi:Flp pilus assembly secretin CpaC